MVVIAISSPLMSFKPGAPRPSTRLASEIDAAVVIDRLLADAATPAKGQAHTRHEHRSDHESQESIRRPSQRVEEVPNKADRG